MFGGDRAKVRRVKALNDDVEALLSAQQAADTEYARVAERNVEVRCSSFYVYSRYPPCTDRMGTTVHGVIDMSHMTETD